MRELLVSFSDCGHRLGGCACDLTGLALILAPAPMEAPQDALWDRQSPYSLAQRLSVTGPQDVGLVLKKLPNGIYAETPHLAYLFHRIVLLERRSGRQLLW